jgi:predicted HicB family RNase H-like nuclease
MLHIRLDPDLHKTIRLIVAEQDTTLQDWVTRALKAAVSRESIALTRSETDR